jgi:hypothetical protein
MVLSGERQGPNGPVMDRIRWTPLGGGKVEQKWTTSSDHGKSWKDLFVGTYTRR